MANVSAEQAKERHRPSLPQGYKSSEFRGIASVANKVKEVQGRLVYFEDMKRILDGEINLKGKIVGRSSNDEFLIHEDQLGTLALEVGDYLERFVTLTEAGFTEDDAKKISTALLKIVTPGERWRDIRINNLYSGRPDKLQIHRDDVASLPNGLCV